MDISTAICYILIIMGHPKNSPVQVSFSDRRKRNVWLFDAGLHTLKMEPKTGEWDAQFVKRFLLKFFKGCRNRGGKKYRDYMMMHRPGDDYISIFGIK